MSMRTAPSRISAAASSGEMVFRWLIVLVPCWRSSGGASRAINALEQCKQALRVGVGDAVVHGLRLAPCCEQTFFAHLGEMLRKRRLAYADGVDQVVDRELARQHQPAQDQQPV